MSPTLTIERPQLRPRKTWRLVQTGHFQPEIQGLRAIAVMAVVAYHFWPTRLSGGYVGVDVFFVISGFLITSHLFREATKSGTISLAGFWARRIRRLLPASLLVLLVTLLGVFLWAPKSTWETAARQIGASALYVQNWALAGDAVDYSAQHNDASAVQHFWSLSVEEQFYVCWPLLFLGLLFVSAKLGRLFPGKPWASPRTIITAGLALIAAASFAYSVFATANQPAVAYFATPVRAWEFAGGALLALILGNRQIQGKPGTALAWLGLGLIAYSSLVFTSATPFPGWTAAVPVAGTLLVIAGAASPGPYGPRRWLTLKPVTFLGDASYGIYLWHWPLLIIAPFVLDRPLGTVDKFVLLLAAVALAWISKVTVEDPLRKGKFLRSRLKTYLLTASAMGLVVALCVGLNSLVHTAESASAEAKAQPCYGPGALNPANKCGPVAGKGEPVPGPAAVAGQNREPLHPGCQGDYGGSDLVSCELGVPESEAKDTVAIIGDSHATAWFPAIEELAAKHKWRIKTFAKASCPATTALRILPNEANDQNQLDCHAWGEAISGMLARDKSISTVFTASYSTAYAFKAAPGETLANPAVDGFIAEWKTWIASGKKVVVFDDVPRTKGQYIPTCLESHPNKPLDCATPVSKAFPSNTAITQAATRMDGHGITRIRSRDQLCDASLCHAVIGTVIVFRDYSHLSAEYSAALAPFIDSQLSK